MATLERLTQSHDQWSLFLCVVKWLSYKLYFHYTYVQNFIKITEMSKKNIYTAPIKS